MVKYKITNTSSASPKGSRNVFLIEAGKLLRPGDFCCVNRIDGGTRALEETGVLRVEEGEFNLPPLFADQEPYQPKTKHRVIEVTAEEPLPPPQPKAPAPEPEPVKASEIFGDAPASDEPPQAESEPADPSEDSEITASTPKKSGRRR